MVMELTLSAADRALLRGAQGGQLRAAADEGRVFVGNSGAAGSVLPIYSATAQKFGLWNPAGNTKKAIIHRLTFTYVSTTGAAGGFVLALVKNAPAMLATGAAITAFTDGTFDTDIFNAQFGSKQQPTCRFAPAAATVTAPIIGRHLGLNQLVITAADATNTQWNAECEFDGDLQMLPGTAVFLAGNIATLITMAPSIVWEEAVL